MTQDFNESGQNVYIPEVVLCSFMQFYVVLCSFIQEEAKDIGINV